MTISIPVIGTLSLILAYVVVGMIAYIPFVLWSNRFIASKPKGLSRARFGWAMIASIVLWPIVLISLIRTEIDYRKKGYL